MSTFDQICGDDLESHEATKDCPQGLLSCVLELGITYPVEDIAKRREDDLSSSQQAKQPQLLLLPVLLLHAIPLTVFPLDYLALLLPVQHR